MKLARLRFDRIIGNLMRVMPVLPLVMKRKRTPIAAYILGGIGLALLGGIAAVAIGSPRTRDRALSAAKRTYGKVNDRFGRMRGRIAEGPMANGLIDRGDYPTSGL